jgi:DNA-binding CsgD family transcriptional regulator
MGNFLDTLSPRERQVAMLVLQGKSNNEICLELKIVIQTVKYHVARLYRKGGVKNRSQFIVKVLPDLTSGPLSGS